MTITSFISSLKERFALSTDKNLVRLDYLINQIICACFIFTFSVIGFAFLPAAVAAFKGGSLWIAPYAVVVGACLIVVGYFSVLSLCNTQGRFNNLGIENKVFAWIIYLLVGFNTYTALLRYLLYLLPQRLLVGKI